jgi:tetratricopeptide (TPR) repeat protein
MKIKQIPKLNVLRLFLRILCCWLLPAGAFTDLSAQDTPISADTLFHNLQAEAEAAILALDRFRVKGIAQQIRELGETRERPDISMWGKFYMGDGLMRENPTEAKLLIDEALPFFEEREDLIHIGRCHSLLGSIQSNLNKIEDGIGHYKTAITYFERAETDSNRQQTQRRITATNSNIGLAYLRMGLFDQASDYLFKAEKIAAQGTDTILLGAIINNLGNVFFMADRPEESQPYYRKAYQLARQSGHFRSLLMACTGLGNSFFKMEQLDSSLFYAEKAADLLRSDNDMVSLCISLNNLANIYGQMGDYTKSDSITSEVVEIAREHQLSRYEALAFQTKAECAYHRQEYQAAVDFGEHSFELIGGAGDLSFLKDIHATLFQAYEGLQDYERALEHHKQFKTLSDSILNENSLNKIQELQTRYDTERKEQEIEQLSKANLIQELEHRQTRSRYLIGIAGLCLVGAVFFFYNRQRILVTNNQKLEVEQRLLRAQMNPHFIFNALTSIQTFLLQDGQTQKGVYYLSRFAKLIRRILEHSRVNFVSLEDELETIEHYLSLQQLRYDHQFDYRIELDPDIDASEIQFPPMLLQPAVENAVEHGDLTRVAGGIIIISIHQTDDHRLEVEVRDNGIGRAASKHKSGPNGHEQHHSLSGIIIQERIELLQKTYDRATDFSINDAPEGGTIVHFDFPLKPITP